MTEPATQSKTLPDRLLGLVRWAMIVILLTVCAHRLEQIRDILALQYYEMVEEFEYEAPEPPAVRRL